MAARVVAARRELLLLLLVLLLLVLVLVLVLAERGEIGDPFVPFKSHQDVVTKVFFALE
jgi:hypothetical protein